MAEIQTGDSKGRSKNLDLNLVPFIDLMSVLITFLLITAVWTQVSMIQIGSSVYGKKNQDSSSPQLPPDVDVVLRLDVLESGYSLRVSESTFSIPIVGGNFDEEKLLNQLKDAKSRYPSKVDAVVMMADTLPYERLIVAMDTLLAAGFSQISVATGGPN